VTTTADGHRGGQQPGESRAGAPDTEPADRPEAQGSGLARRTLRLREALRRLRNQAATTEFETEAGPADYALWDHSEALGVVEAKKVTLGPQGVLTQAERYSRGFTANPIDYGDGFRVPFLYSTNGEVIWFHDIREPLNRSRRVSAFHTPAALREMLDRDSAAELKALEALPANPYLRPYQHEANEGIEGAIRNRKRKMLVAMATGTGKTVTLVNEVYRLMKSGVARRVLSSSIAGPWPPRPSGRSPPSKRSRG